MRIGLYARVSSRSQDESLGPQLERLRERARRRWPDADLVEYSDVASGAHLRRPGLASLLHQVERQRVDVVLVEHLDRLSRVLVESLLLVERISLAGCGLVTMDMPIDTSTPAGKLSLNVLLAVAEWQRETIRERCRRGVQAARARGVRFGRPRVAPEVDLASVAERCRSGESLGAIARELGISRATLYRRLAEAKRARPATPSRTSGNGHDGAPDPRADP